MGHPETPADHQVRLAQEAAYRRLMIGNAMQFEEDDLLREVDPPGSYDELAAPFDGCDVCVVREVLDAAWPFIVGAGEEMGKEIVALRDELERCKDALR